MSDSETAHLGCQQKSLGLLTNQGHTLLRHQMGAVIGETGEISGLLLLLLRLMRGKVMMTPHLGKEKTKPQQPVPTKLLQQVPLPQLHYGDPLEQPPDRTATLTRIHCDSNLLKTY